MKWKTIKTTCFMRPVSRDENPAAHGGICNYQGRETKNGRRGRLVNVNGNHYEVGEPFDLSDEMLEEWIKAGG